MMRWIVLFIVLQVSVSSPCAGGGGGGGYSVGSSFRFFFDDETLVYWGCSSQGTPWFTSGPYSTSTPRPSSIRRDNGTDSLGPFQRISLIWSPSYVTSFRMYHELLVFSQEWPLGASNCSTFSGWTPCTDQYCPGVAAVISSFPSLALTDAEPRNFLSFAGYDMIDTGVGRWGHNVFNGSTVAGMPLILYNRELDTLVVSPLENFMTSAQVIDEKAKTLNCGPNGKVSWLPQGYIHETVLLFGNGVNSTLFKWGSALLTRGGKPRPSLYRGKSNQGLSYSTGNGAFYYYNPIPGQTYQDTLLMVQKSFKNQGIPMLNFEFDSWFYYRNSTTDGFKGDGGLLLWEPRPDVFPSLNMSFLSSPLWLHGRYVDPWNWYREPNTSFVFLAEPGNPACVLPVDENFFEMLFSQARQWALGDVVYEQDWMAFQFGALNLTQDNVVNAQRWVDAISSAAEKTGVYTMWDSPLASQIMESSRHIQALQGSAAMDYMPSNAQWRNGWQSMFYWSLGLIPWKDSFFSSTEPQPGCPYPYCQEKNPLLQAMLALLTGGPVTIGDSIGAANKILLQGTMREDGYLLKPDTCGVYLEKTFALDFDAPLALPSSSLLTAGTQIFHNRANQHWHLVLSANLSEPVSLSPVDFGMSQRGAIAYNFFTSKWVHFSQDSPPLVLGPNVIPPWTNETDCNLPPCNQLIDFDFHVIAPVFGNWAVVGEASKYVPVSSARFSFASLSDDLIQARVTFSPGEVVEILVINVSSGAPLTVICESSSNTTMMFVCKQNECQCF